jgi:hypothetical protein
MPDTSTQDDLFAAYLRADAHTFAVRKQLADAVAAEEAAHQAWAASPKDAS